MSDELNEGPEIRLPGRVVGRERNADGTDTFTVADDIGGEWTIEGCVWTGVYTMAEYEWATTASPFVSQDTDAG